MLIFPGLLVDASREAGIDVPEDLENFDSEKFMRFQVFCNAQLGRPMPSPGCHYENAKVIARLDEAELEQITMPALERLGFQ